MYRIRGNIWIETEEGAFVGSGRAELLEQIDKLGSISAAARAMKMSYRQAWELVDSMNRQAGKPVVQTLAGGSGGGGAQVTDEGRRVLGLFRELQHRFLSFSESETKKLRL